MNPKRRKRGAALVEFALVASLLCLLLFGIVEFGLLFADRATLGLAAREAARSAAVGDPTTTVKNNTITAAAGTALTSANITLERSTDSGMTWATLGDSGTNNDAATGNFVRATVSYAHPLITGLIFTGPTKMLTAQAVMRRE